MYNKVYIIGPVGSGKTTFAEKLSNKYNITYYELDKISWDDEHGNVKRSDDEVKALFNVILSKDQWIIEDVGRSKFKQGLIEADIIYYIKLSRIKSYFRVTKRWIRQRLGKERYNAPPNFKQWLYYISTVNSYFKKEKTKLNNLEQYKNKVKFITNKEINKFINER